MSMFKQRRQRDIPQLNMASMPDLIFTVLFFFMIVTHMRSVPVMVKHQVPAGKELTKLSKQPVITYIYIGKPLGGAAADSPSSVVQVNDKIMEVDAISDYMSSLRHSLGKEDVENIMADMVYTIRDALMALPGRLAVDAANASSAAEASDVIRKEVHKIMNELADYEYDPEKFEERVRERMEWSASDDDDD